MGAASIKNFSGLKALGKNLKEQETRRLQAEAQRQQQIREAALEADLFRRAMGQVTPLPPCDRFIPLPAYPLPIARHHLADEQAALRESLSDEFSVDTLLEIDETLSFARHGIGPDVVRKLRRGHWVIQAQLDLHGLRRDEAREALILFIRSATRRGQRCVRIIHGKGLGSINKEPVLKYKVRTWLVQKEEVLAFCEARPVDGGSGALVVLLKAQT